MDVTVCGMMFTVTTSGEEALGLSGPTDDLESDLIDFTEVTLADLPAYDQDALAPIVERLLRRIDDSETITMGYQPQRLD